MKKDRSSVLDDQKKVEIQEEGDETMSKSFGSQYLRLAALKKNYDPTNFFSLNQNIKPAP